MFKPVFGISVEGESGNRCNFPWRTDVTFTVTRGFITDWVVWFFCNLWRGNSVLGRTSHNKLHNMLLFIVNDVF